MSAEYNRGRKTVYKGITMRSRLEASFAAWLDNENVAWSYEPECFADHTGQYLPDFRGYTTTGVPFYYEVKPPTADTSAALLKMHIIRASQPLANLFVVIPTGIYPSQRWRTAGGCMLKAPCAHCLDQPFRDMRMILGADRTVGGYAKCSPEETAAFLADEPWP